MKSELVVDVQPDEISIALMEDDALVEFQKERREASFSVGNIYFGRIEQRRFPSLFGLRTSIPLLSKVSETGPERP